MPHIHVHEKRENNDQWCGAEIQIVIEGNWTTYRVCNWPVSYDIIAAPEMLSTLKLCNAFSSFFKKMIENKAMNVFAN